ncbi:MAG: hypothetical protein HYZ28_28455 [Myxococcales bacterium]|nr:hypothetical protein [Myxococcales bacterium]
MAEPDRAAWERHRDEQRRAWLKLTPEQRLQMIEQLKAFCQKYLGAARRSKREPSS